MVHKIPVSVPDEILQKDLEKYRQRAIELGATDARIITTDMVVIDERVRAKCIVPICDFYGKNAHCPPCTMDLDLVRKMVNNLRYAIFIWLKVPSKELCGAGFNREKGTSAPSALKDCEIVLQIESEAFHDGYHSAAGFSVGPCQSYLCPDKACSALVPGKPCRHAVKARLSMEGAGMDAFLMAAKVGWDVYPIGHISRPSEVPHGSRLGIVLIG